jgi:hypothetical protein
LWQTQRRRAGIEASEDDEAVRVGATNFLPVVEYVGEVDWRGLLRLAFKSWALMVAVQRDGSSREGAARNLGARRLVLSALYSMIGRRCAAHLDHGRTVLWSRRSATAVLATAARPHVVAAANAASEVRRI